MPKKIVIALGGNAIQTSKETGTYPEQQKNIQRTMEQIAALYKTGAEIILTHGNGPQVGNLLIQHDAAKDKVPALPMFICGAQTQGQLGFLMQQSLQNLLGSQVNIVTIITQVLVDQNDPAFKNPSKPVGPFYSEKVGHELQAQGFSVIEDAGRGWRRVVPSPLPKHIMEINTIKQLISNQTLVIASGGGGIPVIMEQGMLTGVDAVIDKDRAGQLLAQEIQADTFIILTDVEKVCLNYQKPNQVELGTINVLDAKNYLAQGHFAKGSMLPKIEAAINFLDTETAKEVIITHPSKLNNALAGLTGTHIIK